MIYNKNLKKIRIITITLLTVVLLALVGTFVFLSLRDNASSKGQNKKPTIALVNEDETASFNKQNYNFGKNFVNLVSNDSKYNWQVVPRAVANKAYDDKSVDAVIYIPQSFSKDILTLQDIDPTKAELDYKVANNQSALSNQMLQNKIVNILYDFNQNIVKMYYASVAGNVAQAQLNMNNVVGSQGSLLNQLSNTIYTPFQTTNQNYSTVISSADALKGVNSSWIEAQNSFTTATVGLLKNTSQTFNEQLPDLTTYFNTQKKIADINLQNANAGITDQAGSDATFYKGLSDTAYNDSLKELGDFSNPDTGTYAKLQNQISQYNDLISNVKNHLDTQSQALEEKESELQDLENQLYLQFFNQTLDVRNTPDSSLESYQNSDNARAALAQLVHSSFEQKPMLPNSYPNQIADLLSSISVGQANYASLFEALGKNSPQSLSTTSIDKYNNELTLLQNYASAFDLPTGTVNFEDAPTTNDQTGEKTLTITVPAGQSYTLNYSTTNATVTLLSSTIVSPSNASETDITTLPNSIILNNPSTRTVTNADGSTTIVPNATPETFKLDFQIDFNLIPNITPVDATVNFSWTNPSNQEVGQSTYTFLPVSELSAYAGGAKFDTITSILNKIDTAASLINFIYGAPGSDYQSLENYTAVSEFEANKESVYNMYNNVDMNDISIRLSDTDVNNYMDLGNSNIEKVADAVKTVQSSISVMTNDSAKLDKNMPANYFTESEQNLQAWYKQITATIDNDHAAWKKNKTILLAENPWKDYSSTNKALYYDKDDSDGLYKTISGLVSSTSKAATDTQKSSQLIKDNSKDFDQLVANVTQTQKSAQTVIKNTNDMIGNTNSDLKKSKDYSTNFSTVLSNTRATGANPNNIFNFFAKPLTTKNVTPKVATVTSKKFDVRWLLVFTSGLLIGVLGMFVSRRIPRKKSE
ncbi:type VII secretion protein EsaA [Lactococcus nasutitermitis]|uniref:Type VII secretion protein EsaA n=1 Tax=Lactococcus nasutitermitis TaxID=1652957 RepID=A0ABV9JD23_9LACT|nr:type VII secretion protein EsaA [Lactococcus nasutitermitis]